MITIYSYMQTALSAGDASDQFMIDFNFFLQIGQGAITDPHCESMGKLKIYIDMFWHNLPNTQVSDPFCNRFR